ncbi:universal stress protein family protein [Chitinophaga polysaccharea]|uniref:Universal stress protein family protein n=1 Tax=Chitinophaga polysaccharea TaxID=1293035 RepID=A0A561Q5R8_9BACT|nr:universal stress protein [Chitinophaga polysaccharea]TWF45710.1 universal stress protein family protein [Chitinophaga polysaccharea]
MKKVLIAFDGTNFSKGALEFAGKLNELAPILLVGVFLPQTDFSMAWSYAVPDGAPFAPLVEAATTKEIEENIKQFEETCIKKHIEYRVHKNLYDGTLWELKKETRFADLLILGSEKFYQQRGTEDYLEIALHDTACPVIITPESCVFPETILLAYDGSDDATYAIKTFAALFPELCNRKAVLLYATSKNHTEIPDQEYIKELAARHYSQLDIQVLPATLKKYFDTWAEEQGHPLLVCGAFGRSGLSQLFRKSFSSEVISEHHIPVFIAHR